MQVDGHFFAEPYFNVILYRGGKFVACVLGVNGEKYKSPIDENSSLYFLYFDVEKRFHAISEGATRVQYIIDQHNTFLFDLFYITVQGDFALLGCEFVDI